MDRASTHLRLRPQDWRALAQAAKDMSEIGRMRTSSELYGRDTRSRDRMLSSMRRMEAMGFVTRSEHSWHSGAITPAGQRYLDTTPPPVARVQRRRADLGLHADGGTRFKKALVELGDAPILAKGVQSAKLGITVTKGRHKGLPMRYVTLEEGRTCPMECAIRSKCYGGNMPLAKRIVWRGEATGQGIADAIQHSAPAMIRLHNLGDFPSLKYARRVLSALLTGGSAAFGFTHHAPETPTGADIRALAAKHWDRFAIRTSYLHGTREPIPERSAVVVEHPEQAALHNAVLCPEQMGKAKSCATCGFCWHSQRPVAFVLHENLPKAA